MAVNRYDLASPYEYVSQYVPIPFLELVTLGKYYADLRKQAEKDLATYIQKANEFTSLLSKDVDTYNKTAFNPQIKQYIEQAASNPSVMKDMSWRSGLLTAVNSVDYSMLNKLKSSAETAKTYYTALLKLAMEGKMPPGWEPNYFDTYSTADSGVFNATPLAYETMGETIKPYMDNLKDSYLYTEGGYDYYGVLPETIATQIDAFKSDILSNPIVQRKIQRHIDSGASREVAINNVLTEANVAGLEFARRNRTANPYSEINAKAIAAAKQAGIGGDPTKGFMFTQSMTADANIKASNFLHNYLINTNKEYQDLGAIVAAGSSNNATPEQKKAATDAVKKQKQMLSSTDFAKTMKDYYIASLEFGEGESIEKNYLTTKQAINGSIAVTQAMPPATIGGGYNKNLTDMIQGVSDKYENGNRMITGANNLSLLPVKMATINGAEVDPRSTLTIIDNALKEGKFGNVAITGAGGVVGFPSGNNSVNYGYVNVELTEDAILNSGIIDFPETDKNGKKLTEAGKRAYIRHKMEEIGSPAYQEDITESTSVVNREQESEYGDSKESKTTTTHSKRRVTKYNIPVTFDLPSTGSGLNAEMLNNSMAGEKYSDSQRGKMQNYNIIQSYLQ